jgi:thiol:disulfide interchange protein
MKREDFSTFLKNKNCLLVVKFTAEWCAPCRDIKKQVADEVAELPANVIYLELDIDAHPDVYACMKYKKQVAGIPALLAYKKENNSWFADFSISGSVPENITHFFQRVKTT